MEKAAARIEGICFDLWNTLALTRHDPHPLDALAEAFGLLGQAGWRRTLERAFMTRVLPGISSALDAVEAAVGRPPSGRWTRRDLVLMWGAACNANALFDDVLPALRALSHRGLRLGLVSNTQSFDLDFLKTTGLSSLLDDQCLSCDCGLLKPDPAIFGRAAQRLGLSPASIVMIGDRVEDDVLAARRAGLRGVLLDRGCATDSGTRTAVPVIHDLAGLTAILDRATDFIAPS